jgi:hypothetical protein
MLGLCPKPPEGAQTSGSKVALQVMPGNRLNVSLGIAVHTLRLPRQGNDSPAPRST